MQGTHDVQLLASMPHLRKLVVHSLAPDAPITPPCAWRDLWIVSFNGDLSQLSRLPLTGLEALRLDRYVIAGYAYLFSAAIILLLMPLNGLPIKHGKSTHNLNIEIYRSGRFFSP